MNEFVFIHKLQRAIKQHLSSLSVSVTSGSIDNFDKYKYITGQISALESVLQEISTLLDKKEQDDNEGNVIRIDKDKDKGKPKN